MSDVRDRPVITQDALIARLARDLRPVRRVLAPWKRTAIWLAAVLWLGVLFGLFTDFATLRHRLLETPDMGLAVAGALGTAVLAAFAAFATSMPDRSPRWGLLPLPAVAVWVSSSTLGCLRMPAAAHTIAEPAGHMISCMYFLLLVSLPLGALMLVLLLRGYPLRPGLTTLLGGLASAGAAAALLSMIHPFDATASDLLAHLAAVIAIVVAVRFAGVRAGPLGEWKKR